MKNLFLALTLISATLVSAQPTQDRMKTRASEEGVAREWKGDRQQFFNSEEMAKALELDQETAEKAWETYSEYQDSKKAVMESMRNERKAMQARGEKMTDADYEKAYRTRLEVQRERIRLDEAYYDKFLEIMPASKVHILLMSNKNRSGKPNHQSERTERAK